MMEHQHTGAGEEPALEDSSFGENFPRFQAMLISATPESQTVGAFALAELALRSHPDAAKEIVEDLCTNLPPDRPALQMVLRGDD